MNVLVTGATGLVGRELVTELTRHNHFVTALVRDPKSAAAKLWPKVKCFAWDGTKSPAPQEAFANVEAVIHLAGESVAGQGWSASRKQALRDSRVLSAQNLRAGLESAGTQLKVYISASGVGYYGDRGDAKLSEGEPPGNDFLARLCVEWEAEADKMPAARIVKARFGAVLSLEGGFLGEIVPLFKRFGAGRLGKGRQWISWIHIDDLVDLLLTALTDERVQGPVNAVAPETVTNAVMTEAIRKAVRAWSMPAAPEFALRLIYGELADALLFSQRAIPKKLEEWRFKFEYPKLKEALDDLLSD